MQGPLLVDRFEAARLLGVCAGTITNLQRRGELPTLKIGARRLFEMADILAFVAAQKGGVK